MINEYVKFSCEECEFKIKALIKNAGKEGKCPNCQSLCIIPEQEYKISDIEKDLKELSLKNLFKESELKHEN